MINSNKYILSFFFQAEDGIRDLTVTGVQTCALPIFLTGEGGDELLAGYLKYRVALWNLRGGPLYRKFVPLQVQQIARKALSSGFAPDWVLRKLRHSFLYYPDNFEQIYFDNFYSAFPQDQQSQLFNSELTEEFRGVNAYANCMRFFPAKGSNGRSLNRMLYLDIRA